MPSTEAPRNYSLRVDLTPETAPDAYWVEVGLHLDGHATHHACRLDNLYEQVQQLVDNRLRQICNQLSSSMREQRKNAKDKT